MIAIAAERAIEIAQVVSIQVVALPRRGQRQMPGLFPKRPWAGALDRVLKNRKGLLSQSAPKLCMHHFDSGLLNPVPAR